MLALIVCFVNVCPIQSYVSQWNFFPLKNVLVVTANICFRTFFRIEKFNCSWEKKKKKDPETTISSL